MSATERFARCLPIVLSYEGGYVNHPRDPGGATNRGITMATLESWRGHACSIADIQGLTVEEAGQIYRARYWNAVQGDALPAGVDLAAFDYAVNSGTRRAAKSLQELIGVNPDGAIGPKTLAAVARFSPGKLASDICARRLAFLRGLDTWGTFGKGWQRRVVDVEARAVQMARDC